MRYQRALIPTVKEAPAEASRVSHILLLRAGYVRRVGAGIYSFLPLGVRVLHKIERIIRDEMNRAGAQEVLLPALLPADYFRETGRWSLFGDTLLRLKDRKRGDYHLGPTHEEIITDLHFREVLRGRDYAGEVADLRSVKDGDPCPECGASLGLYRGIEAGHIFLLGTHYSSKMNARYLDDAGQKHHIVMGCYGIGVSRLVAAMVEQHHDDNGIIWPISVAPYQVHLAQLGNAPEVSAAVEKLELELESKSIEVLVDDRDEHPGVKFKDADLIGIPLRVTVGAKSLQRGGAELKPRTEPDPKQAEIVALDEAAEVIAARVQSGLLA